MKDEEEEEDGVQYGRRRILVAKGKGEKKRGPCRSCKVWRHWKLGQMLVIRESCQNVLCQCVHACVFLSACVSLAVCAHVHQNKFISKKANPWKHSRSSQTPRVCPYSSGAAFLPTPPAISSRLLMTATLTWDNIAADNILFFHSQACISAGNCKRFGAWYINKQSMLPNECQFRTHRCWHNASTPVCIYTSCVVV